MKGLLSFLSLLLIHPALFSQEIKPRYVKTKGGVIIYPNSEFTTTVRSVKIQVITDKIIHVIASPNNIPDSSNSLILDGQLKSQVEWQVSNPNKDQLFLKTKSVVVAANINSGTLQFLDLNGKPILNERKSGRSLHPVIYEGSKSFEINQIFETSADDAWYGLGQHQDGIFNYKGFQQLLFQNNTEVAVPFLLSKKNYGILWDNYSITKVGDIRSYNPLSKLKLYSKDGEQGWLTTSFSNDKNQPEIIYTQTAVSDINCEYLNDSKQYFPEGFNASNGMVKWEGAVASDSKGVHKLRFTYGGYMKIWLDGKLVLDRWRQCWNPGSAIIDADFEPNKKYALKIEWIPDGGVSYASFKWLPPIEEKDINSFGFSSEAGRQEDYYFVSGKNMDDVISGYRQLTGKATILPKWAFGFWQSRERYKSQDEILNTVSEFRRRKIPLDNIVLDWNYWVENAWGSQEFDASRFPNPESMINTLHQQYHTNLMISVWPKFYEGIPAYKEFDKNGWLYKRSIAEKQRDWIGKGYVSTFYDPFNEQARKGFWKLLDQKLFSKGIDAWWMDASEPDIVSNVSPVKRKELMYPLAAGITAEYVNAYPLQNAKGIYEGQRQSDPNKRVFVLTRSSFAGMQRYASATWSGDISSTWPDMKSQIAAGLNFSMSGNPYWTMDAGGFAVQNKFVKPNSSDLEEWRELMTRWYQFGSFTPLFRAHGQFPYREIFNIAPEEHPAYKSMRYYISLRYKLLPYTYSLAGLTYHENNTIMRGLVMDFPVDSMVNNINDAYLFGPSLLVSPVYTFKERVKEMYLPKGSGWYDFYSGKYYKGGQKILANAPYERMPIFVKEGSIIPVGPEIQYTSEKMADTITLYVFAGKDASFTLYEDEGTNYNYESGKFSKISIKYIESEGKLIIGKRVGDFNGMIKQRIFNILLVNNFSTNGMDLPEHNLKTIAYDGDEKNLQIK